MSNETGPDGLQAANYLTDSLKELGIEMFRFKTGTPARIAGNSIDYSKMEEQFGDERVVPFSFSTNPDDVQIEQKSCWLTYTNEKTHEIIRANLDRSPLYSGAIEGTGPRYCPSIEDKVVRFADKNRHQVFIEPEGIDVYKRQEYVLFNGIFRIAMRCPSSDTTFRQLSLISNSSPVINLLFSFTAIENIV